MELNDEYRQRVDALLRRASEAMLETRALSGTERVDHLSEMLGLIHSLTSVELDLAAAPPEWAYGRHAVARAIDLLTERIRIISDPGMDA